MPQLSMGSDEVVVREWLTGIGETFSAGQTLMEIETDKAAMEVEAPFDGMLVDQRCAGGDAVPVGAVYGYAAPVGVTLEDALAELPRDGAVSQPDAPMAVPVAAAGERAPAGLVAFVAVEHGELAGVPLVVEPSGNGAGPPAAPAVLLDDRTLAGPARERRLSRRRRAIGRRMSAATAIPAFVVTREVDAEAAKAAVARARAGGLRVTFTDVLLRACAGAARANPAVNAWLVDGTVLDFEHVNVSLAVDAPDGVMAPVVRQVEGLDLAGIAAARADLVERARADRLDEGHLLGATLTLSNVAGLGAHTITPVLTAPQTAAIGVGMARPVDGRARITVTFVGDHRVLDGADGARFLRDFAAALESESAQE